MAVKLPGFLHGLRVVPTQEPVCTCARFTCALLLAMTSHLCAAEAGASAASAAKPAPSQAATRNFGLQAAQLGVIVNDEDSNSVAIGREYLRAYAMPSANLLHVRFNPKLAVFDVATFTELKDDLERQTPPSIQAYLVTWLKPYSVHAMSLTSALAFGWGPQWESAHLCATTARSPYFNSGVTLPYTQLHIRPSMMLGARNSDEARALISRGQLAGLAGQGGSPFLRPPTPAAYLMVTSDKVRMARLRDYPVVAHYFANILPVNIIKGDILRDRSDIMFYFTGLQKVEGLQTLRFLPGAVADHLTSFGGMIPDSYQMSAISWLDAGATGSYGTVVEPCSLPQKFPRPSLLMLHYLAGQTLIESYWNSVEEPGEGNFIGNPLAQPFKPHRAAQH